jgi:hypothetical protein
MLIALPTIRRVPHSPADHGLQSIMMPEFVLLFTIHANAMPPSAPQCRPAARLGAASVCQRFPKSNER